MLANSGPSKFIQVIILFVIKTLDYWEIFSKSLWKTFQKETFETNTNCYDLERKKGRFEKNRG